jgi:carbon storage regulator
MIKPLSLQDEEKIRGVVILFSFRIFQGGGDPMLVLGRKPGEYIVIDGSIIVKVVKSEAGDLRLAIDAPKNIEILRGEIFESLQKKNTII